jgi:hypothetical protein
VEFEADVRALLDAITPHVGCVRWLDIPDRPDIPNAAFRQHAPRLNEVLRRVVAEYPNVRTMHYQAWARLAGPDAFLSDRLHLSRSGEAQMGRIVRQAADGCDPAITPGPYWDVPSTYWAAPAITWMASSGLAAGYGNGTYRAVIGMIPVPVTRAQVATWLWRRAGSPAVDAAAPWVDVPAWAAEAIGWLAQQGIATGYPGNRFRPNDPITRAQLVRMLYREAGSPDVSSLPVPPFPDVPTFAAAAIRWAAGTELVTGFPDGTFGSDRAATRAQLASLLWHQAGSPTA